MPSSKLGEEAFREKFRGMCFRGCPNCKHSCFQRLAPSESHILNYRKSFHDLPRAAQDRDLLWIFSNCALDHDQQAISKEHSDMEHTSPTPTSPSSTAPATPKADTPEVKGEGSQEHAELTSESTSSSEMEASPKRQADEHTSSSSEMEPLVDNGAASSSNLKRKASPKRQGYQKRRRTSNHEPTIPVQGIFANSRMAICRKAAEIYLHWRFPTESAAGAAWDP